MSGPQKALLPHRVGLCFGAGGLPANRLSTDPWAKGGGPLFGGICAFELPVSQSLSTAIAAHVSAGGARTQRPQASNGRRCLRQSFACPVALARGRGGGVCRHGPQRAEPRGHSPTAPRAHNDAFDGAGLGGQQPSPSLVTTLGTCGEWAVVLPGNARPWPGRPGPNDVVDRLTTGGGGGSPPLDPPPPSPLFQYPPARSRWGAARSVRNQNPLEERVLDQAQARASYTPPFGGRSRSIPQCMVSDV